MVSCRILSFLCGAILAVNTSGCHSLPSSIGEEVSNQSADAGPLGTCRTLELVTEIGQMPGDVEFLSTMLSVEHSRHPEDCVRHTPLSLWGVVDRIDEAMAAGLRPDVIEIAADQVSTFFKRHGADSLYPLDEYLASSEANPQENIYPFLLEDAKINGVTYGIPLGVLATNGYYYNKTMFAENHITLPTTLTELRNVCATLKGTGITPFGVMGMAAFLQDIVASAMGPDAFYRYMKGGVPDETLLRAAIDAFEDIGTNCVDLSNDPTALDARLLDLYSGKNALAFSAEWVDGALIQLGWTPGIDFGFAFAPGTDGLFLYYMQQFSVMSNATNLQGALHFLDSAIDSETQSHLPITHARKYTDSQKNALHSERKIIAQGMEQASYRIAVNNALPWEGPAYAFLQSHDKEALLQVLMTTR